MSDLKKRLATIEHILEQPLRPQAKLIQSGQQLSGINLSRLTPEVRESLETNLLPLNHLLSCYDIITFDDYDKISPEDMEYLLNYMWGLCLIVGSHKEA